MMHGRISYIMNSAIPGLFIIVAGIPQVVMPLYATAMMEVVIITSIGVGLVHQMAISYSQHLTLMNREQEDPHQAIT